MITFTTLLHLTLTVAAGPVLAATLIASSAATAQAATVKSKGAASMQLTLPNATDQVLTLDRPRPRIRAKAPIDFSRRRPH